MRPLLPAGSVPNRGARQPGASDRGSQGSSNSCRLTPCLLGDGQGPGHLRTPLLPAFLRAPSHTPLVGRVSVWVKGTEAHGPERCAGGAGGQRGWLVVSPVPGVRQTSVGYGGRATRHSPCPTHRHMKPAPASGECGAGANPGRRSVATCCRRSPEPCLWERSQG